MKKLIFFLFALALGAMFENKVIAQSLDETSIVTTIDKSDAKEISIYSTTYGLKNISPDKVVRKTGTNEYSIYKTNYGIPEVLPTTTIIRSTGQSSTSYSIYENSYGIKSISPSQVIQIRRE
jgi:hypothetical protein